MTDADWAQRWMDGKEEMKPGPSRIPGFYNSQDLLKMGVLCGKDCHVSHQALLLSPEKISMGDHVRVDAFTVLSPGAGAIHMGSYIHISTHCLFIGAAEIMLSSHAQVAAGCKLFSASDDFMGRGLVGPMVPEHTRRVKSGRVILERYAVMGANSIIMPGVSLGEGSMMLANSVLTESSDDYVILKGQPAVFARERRRDFLAHLGPDGIQPK